MNGRTELTAALAGFINGIFGVVSALGIWTPAPELVASINGVLIPVIMIFLAARVTKVETQATIGAVQATTAAAQSTSAANTSARVEAAQPLSG
jgi:hypothetical protein